MSRLIECYQSRCDPKNHFTTRKTVKSPTPEYIKVHMYVCAVQLPVRIDTETQVLCQPIPTHLLFCTVVNG